jgi:TRAP-type mannitol/chloroaromatic compound transport system substrate-binding protein
MSKLTRFVAGSVVGLTLGCQSQAPETDTVRAAVSSTQNIPVRVFSVSPSLGTELGGSSNPRDPKYGALQIFFDRVSEKTNGAVTLSPVQWSPNAGNTVITQVGVNDDPLDASNGGVARDAAYDNGSALNPLWGFVFNSTPFGLPFERMYHFLYKRGGLALAQRLVETREPNVKVLPVVGSDPQFSGYFKQPIGTAECTEGMDPQDCSTEPAIGLAGLCLSGWNLRYLPPAQYVLDLACDQLVGKNNKTITFVSAVPGGGSLLAGVLLKPDPIAKKYPITGFEYATALDDYEPPPPVGGGVFPALPALNPGHRGLRFVHRPSWHQPFYMGWIMLNKTSVWDTLTPEQQSEIEDAAEYALQKSYVSSQSRQCEAVHGIFNHNNDQLQFDVDGNQLSVSADMKWAAWPPEALSILKVAAQQYLESLKGEGEPDVDHAAYRDLMGELQSFMHGYEWRAEDFTYPADCGPDE